MANWYGTARSNYFRVKDEPAFRQEAARLGLKVVASTLNKEFFMVCPATNDSGGWPVWSTTEGDGDNMPLELDIVASLSKHLVEGEIVVLLEAGAEGIRYITGRAVAFDFKGQRIDLRLDDIYSMAAKKFKMPVNSITKAEY